MATWLPPYSGPFALGRPHHASTPRQGVRPQGFEGVEVEGEIMNMQNLEWRNLVQKI